VLRGLRSEYWLRLNPWSLPALLVALTGLAAAVAIRMVLASFGLPLYFATFFPVILVTSLIAGAPAGAFNAVAAVIVVWWAFIPPAFEFGALDRSEIDNFQIFLLSMALLIWFAHLCRTVARMRAVMGSRDRDEQVRPIQSKLIRL